MIHKTVQIVHNFLFIVIFFLSVLLCSSLFLSSLSFDRSFSCNYLSCFLIHSCFYFSGVRCLKLQRRFSLALPKPSRSRAHPVRQGSSNSPPAKRWHIFRREATSIDFFVRPSVRMNGRRCDSLLDEHQLCVIGQKILDTCGSLY